MASYVNLAGIPVKSCTLTVPYYGAPTADVSLAIASSLPDGPLTLQIGSMSVLVSVLRAASFAGARSARLVGGYGGWGKPLPALGYYSEVGVKLSHVLGDAAIDAGEQVVVDVDRELGVRWVREAAPGAQLLRQLTRGAWWMGLDGVTHVSARPSTAIKSDFQVLSYSGGKGRFEIATEAPADWVPGATFTTPLISAEQTIESVAHMIGNDGKARLDVLTSALGGAPPTLRQLVREAPAFLTFFGSYDYVVAEGTTDAFVNAAPASSDVPLPGLTHVPMAPSLGCERVQLAVGSKCTLRFRNADPSKPEIAGGDFDETPVTTRLGGATGAAPAARKGDDVVCAYTVVTGAGSLDSIYSGTTAGAIAAAARAASLGGGAVVNTITGAIAKGSDHVSIGGAAV